MISDSDRILSRSTSRTLCRRIWSWFRRCFQEGFFLSIPLWLDIELILTRLTSFFFFHPVECIHNMLDGDILKDLFFVALRVFDEDRHSINRYGNNLLGFTAVNFYGFWTFAMSAFTISCRSSICFCCASFCFLSSWIAPTI